MGKEVKLIAEYEMISGDRYYAVLLKCQNCVCPVINSLREIYKSW